MLVQSGLSGLGEDISEEEMKKLIEAGDRIEKIASGEIFATAEERDAAIKLVAKIGA